MRRVVPQLRGRGGGELKWEGLVLEQLGEAYELDVDCTPGEYMCYGGWSDSGLQWGCSDDCQQYCADCCTACDLAGYVTLTLICS